MSAHDAILVDGGLVRITLAGRFAVTSPEGCDLTPTGAKAQGLLALLATSPDLCRNRRWLEDKLWSDRGREQASASLRQALTEVRRALAPAGPVLGADRAKVWLDRQVVAIELGEGGEAEFLEGIDVRDPEFEMWLRLERLRRATPLSPNQAAPPVPPPVAARLSQAAPGAAGDPGGGAWSPEPRRVAGRAHVVVMQRSRQAADALALLEDLFIDCVALSLREALGLTVYTRRPSPLPPQTIEVTVQAYDGGGGRRGLRVRAAEPATGRVVWSNSSMAARQARAPSEDLETILFSTQVVEALADALTLAPVAGQPTDALAIQRLAVRKMWTMHPARMAEADALLQLADQMDPRGLIKAWQAQLRVFRLIERHGSAQPADASGGDDPETLREEADALCRQALEREPNNSMVLAVAAYVRGGIDRDPSGSVELARRGVRLNPNNPLAWDSLSIAKLYSGQVSEAHEIALRVQRMGAATPNKFWWDMGLCVSAAAMGDASLALRMAEASAAQAPDFRAALRYVVALAARAGAVERAQAAAERLAQLEPGFSLDRLARDADYPVGALRRSGLLDGDRLRAIGS